MPQSNDRNARPSFAFLLAALGGFALLVAAYSNVFRNGFHFDDTHVVVDNIFIRNLDFES